MSAIDSQEQPVPPAPAGAGARLAAARRQQGLHIAALAAQLKVPQARLEALEAERWSQLPDATHARALATSVCRVLGLDPVPVLAGMPRGPGAALERVSAGLNQPVRDGGGWALPRGAWWLGALALLLVAAALALWPRDGAWGEFLPHLGSDATVQPPAEMPSASAAPALVTGSESSQPAGVASFPGSLQNAPAATSASSSVAAAAPSSVPLVETLATEQQSSPPAATAPPTAAGTLLEIRANQGASWISVVDGQGVSLASRLLQQGEVLALDEARAPLRLVLGNAPALSLRWRGQNQALDAYAQTRVARLELK